MYDDLSDEITQHLSEKVDTLISEGMSRQEAEYAARREFGNVTGIEERSRDVWTWPMADTLIADVRFAIRQLRKNYGFALSAILTLSLGIGATTAIFSLVDAVLLRPLPFPEPSRLMWLSQHDHSLPGLAAEALSYPDYFDWRAQNHTFAGMASYVSGSVTLEAGGEARRLDTATVSGNFFAVLGAQPMLGRDFRFDDEKPGNRAVMLSSSLWRSAFGSDPAIAGTTIKLGDRAYTVAGVMPDGFQFPMGNPSPGLWISLADEADGKDPAIAQRGFDVLGVIGRLKPGLTLEQAKADLSLIAANLAREYPDNNKWYSSALVEPELQRLTGDTRPALRLLFGAVTIVLLIACFNVAGLLLARGSQRRAEFALRASLGASRAAIVRQLLVESVVLSLCGGLAGVALAWGLLRGMLDLMRREIPRMHDASIDGSVLLFVIAVSILTGIVFGLFPAWRMSETKPVQALRDGSRSVAGGRGQHRVHNMLVITQTALGLVLLVGSGLLIRSFAHILTVDPGFDSRNVLTAKIGLSFDKLKRDQHLQFYDQLLARVSAFPGVQSASAGWPMPMSDSNASITFGLEGTTRVKGDWPNESMGVVVPGYFETMRIPLIAGRLFRAQDSATGPAVIIIDQAFARKYFPGQDPVGRRIEVSLGDGVFNHPMREIVGVVGEIRNKALTAGAAPQYYLPYSQALITNPYLVIRTSGDPESLRGALRAAIHEMDKSVPLYQVRTLDNYISRSAAQPRFRTILLSCFAGISLLLAAIGLYGLLSYMVVRRTLEIGLRMALGAQRSEVLRMIVGRGLVLGLIGVGSGLAISAMLTRLLSGMLFGIRAFDPVTFAATSGVFLLVSLAASSLPAYRAAQLDPIETLRGQ